MPNILLKMECLFNFFFLDIDHFDTKNVMTSFHEAGGNRDGVGTGRLLNSFISHMFQKLEEAIRDEHPYESKDMEFDHNIDGDNSQFNINSCPVVTTKDLEAATGRIRTHILTDMSKVFNQYDIDVEKISKTITPEYIAMI